MLTTSSSPPAPILFELAVDQRYGASLRKQVKKMEISQHARYTCTFCGKVCTSCTIDSVIGQPDWFMPCSCCGGQTYRTLLRGQPLVSGNARHVGRLSLVEHGLCQQLPLPLCAGVFGFWYTFSALVETPTFFPPSTIRRLRELTEA